MLLFQPNICIFMTALTQSCNSNPAFRENYMNNISLHFSSRVQFSSGFQTEIDWEMPSSVTYVFALVYLCTMCTGLFVPNVTLNFDETLERAAHGTLEVWNWHRCFHVFMFCFCVGGCQFAWTCNPCCPVRSGQVYGTSL
jgi:hypothetical protein